MGEIFAILSMSFFAAANVLINRGFEGTTRGRGAFLSIMTTFLVSGAIWLGIGFTRGFPEINRQAVAWFAVAGVLTVFIGRVFLYASLQSIGAIKGSAVKRLNPFFAVLLGVLLLGESVSGSMAFGMVLIFSSFAVLVRQSLRTEAEVEPLQKKPGTLSRLAAMGYFYGPISAFAYATGYVARKQGLIAMPDAVFGTLVGALTGIVCFVLMSGFVNSYREDLERTFTVFNPWLMAAGILATLGQICYFVALNHSSVSKIALITSMEVFVTMFLSYVLYRGKLKITGEVVVAATLGLVGTIFVIGF